MFSNSKKLIFKIAFILASFMATLSPGVYAQQTTHSNSSAIALPAPSQALKGLSLVELKLKRAKVETSQDSDDANKKSALNMLDQAIRLHELRNEFHRKTMEISQMIAAAPERLKKIQEEISRPFPSPDPVQGIAIKMNAFQLEQRLQQEQAQLAGAQNTLAAWNDQLDKQKNLLEQLPQIIAEAKTRLKAVNDELQAPPPPDEPTQVTESRRLSLLAELPKIEAEIKLYEQQLNGHEILVSLLTAERDLTAREAAGRETLVNAWQAQVGEKRQQEAEKAREQAEEAKEKTPELAAAVKSQYDINIKLSADLEKLTRKETLLQKKGDQIQKQLQELEEESALAKERVENMVMSEAIGLALRQERQVLPSPDKYHQSSIERQIEMSEVREIQIELERRLRPLSDLETEIGKIIDSLVYLPPDKAVALYPDARKLLTDRRELLTKLLAGYNRYFKNLRNLEFVEQQMVAKAEEYADFLDAHLLWIRSSSIVNFTDFRNSIEVLNALVDPVRWRLAARDALDSFRDSSGLWVLVLLISAMLLFWRKRARHEVSRTAERINQQHKDSFSLTLWILALTVYLAVGFPFLMFSVAWQLLQLPGAHDFTRAIATGLMSAAGLLAAIRFFYHLCRRDGLAHVHFKWNEPARKELLRNLRWVTPVVVLMGFLVSAMSNVKEIESADSMAKLALMIQMIAASAFLGRILRFSGGVVSTLLKNHPAGWLARLRYVWWPVAVGMPLFLAILAAIGYFLSALQFRDLIRATILLWMLLIVLNSLALRWLSLAQRRFAMQEARRKMEAHREATRRQHAERLSTQKDDGKTISTAEPEIGLAEIDEQTRSLLRTVMFILVSIGIWTIWEPVFPAFEILQDVHLWSYSGVVDGVTETIPISLANLVMAIFVVAITIIASRNLPGLLEITLLNRLPMDLGARYAFATLCRYAITAIGIILAFNTIGFKWSSVQWLIAALGVGLGFGLQEIVANFICGLIVLFERPFRVGDTVTIGEVNGTVSRIRIRATTIVDWDRKELIVPNKEFITGRLINWSLSDPITRFIIPVGIAYGSDTELAQKLLMKAAEENPLVLKNPKPTAYFLGFGDNSFNFELRIFINNIDNRLIVQHQLHQVIDREFRKAGIVISFPQRDVHFDSNNPLEIRVVSDRPHKKSDESDPGEEI